VADFSNWQRHVMPSLDARRRRACYRALHRGTREMDWLLGRYAAASASAMSEPELEAFERLLAMPDPDLQHWIVLGQGPGTSEFAPLVAAIRKFHGLEQ
jgi:antitoxin CptB